MSHGHLGLASRSLGRIGGAALLTWGCAGMTACGGPDWRPAVIAAAEAGVRGNVGDPKAQFSRVQVTGDDKTGQTCGFVTGKSVYGDQPYTVRFIVYIDASAGPYVEANEGKQPISQSDFDNAWQSDCVKEGYNS